jgi:hypothetical protein
MCVLKTISVRDADLISDLLREDGISLQAAILEKDVIAADAVALIAGLGQTLIPNGATSSLSLVFCGGTCLSQAYGLIKRISEDVDFKVIVPDCSGNARRIILSQLRGRLVAQMTSAGFHLVPDSLRSRNDNAYITADFAYESRFPAATALRPHLKVELTANAPKEPSLVTAMDLHPIVYRLTAQGPLQTGIRVIGLRETLVEKVLSYLRRTAQHRADLGRGEYDDYLVRHLYDVHCLTTAGGVASDTAAGLFTEVLQQDIQQFGSQHAEFEADPRTVLREELDHLDTAETADRYATRLVPMVYGDSVAFPDAVQVFTNAATTLLG